MTDNYVFAGYKQLDTSLVMTSIGPVHRERVVMSDPDDPAGLAEIKNEAPDGSEYGMLVRIVGSVTVSGAVTVTGSVTANAGTNLNTSALALEAGNVATVKTNTDPLVVAAAGGYVRQDSTATIAKESGGNLATLVAKDFSTSAKQDTGNTSLATIAAKDFATQTTLAALAAEDFSTETTLALIKAKTDNLDVSLSGGGTHVIVDSMPAAASAATATADEPEYTEAASEAFSQDLTGHLRVRVAAVVSDVAPTLLDGAVFPLSITNDGRLRVASVEAQLGVNFFMPSEGRMWGMRDTETDPFGDSLRTEFTFSGSPWGGW